MFNSSLEVRMILKILHFDMYFLFTNCQKPADSWVDRMYLWWGLLFFGTAFFALIKNKWFLSILRALNKNSDLDRSCQNDEFWKKGHQIYECCLFQDSVYHLSSSMEVYILQNETKKNSKIVQGVTKRMATPIIQNMAYFLSFHAKVMKKITLVMFRCDRWIISS